MITSIVKSTCLALGLLAICVTVHAQGDVNLISVDTVIGQISADQIEAGENYMWLRYATDAATGGVTTAINNFVLYSPDSASISNIRVWPPGGTLPGGLELGDLLSMTYYKEGNSGTWTAAGMPSTSDADTAGINLFVFPLEGRGPLPSDTNFIMYGLVFEVDPCDAGRHICIDSTHTLAPGEIPYQWEWHTVNPPSPAYPDWSGVRCFEIVNSGGPPAGCCCIPPTVGDTDQSGAVDITDVSILVDNQFLTLTPLICEEEGDVDFSGVVDISDLSILIDNQFLTLTPLPPCP